MKEGISQAHIETFKVMELKVKVIILVMEVMEVMKILKVKQRPLLAVLYCPPKVAVLPDHPNLGHHLQMINMII